ncbi:MAG: hypothetical protein HWQ41_26965 [Nostoc sp. NOS(2021)]|uniref:hypothetical protein n=1 Tax=Nostoc sp. NOS(2021) TaxID=2815407 RepID=UPI0025E63F21|nr:hypothetical protein [Nostoc sp. NOS(2021)]MBN3898778.1 hypothetical protein [Nostoc sp. NOS(2021)]
MKKVFALIEKESTKFAQLPFFEFLGNKSIDFIQRLSFAPCFALFVMGYGDLNKFVWLQEATVNSIPDIVNKQIREEENHWIWFLNNLEYLNLNLFLNFTDSLKFNWSEHTVICRQISFQVNPIYKLVGIESIESISNLFLSITAPVTQKLKVLTNREYPYFVNAHLLAENDHNVHSHETKEFIASMHLAEYIHKQACELVNKIFELFTALVDMLINFAEEYKIKQLLNRSRSHNGRGATAGVKYARCCSFYVTLFSTRRYANNA